MMEADNFRYEVDCVCIPTNHRRNTMSVSKKRVTPLKVNGIYTKFVPIHKLKRNVLNAVVYGSEYLKDNKEYISDLSDSIDEHGLDHALEVCSDGITLIGGHHRLGAIIGLQYDEVPVIVTEYEAGDFNSPTHKLSMMNMLVRNNMQNTYSQWRRFEQAERWCEVYEETHGEEPTKDIFNKQFGSSIGFTWAPLTQGREVRDGYKWKVPNDTKYDDLPPKLKVPPREDLLLNVQGVSASGKKLGKSRSFKSAHNTQRDDAIASFRLEKNPMRKEHDRLNIDRAVILAIKESVKWIQSLLEYETEFCGQKVKLGFDQDANTKTAMLHGGITKLLPAALLKENGIESEAPDGGAHFDVTAKEQFATGGYEWQLEVKCNAGVKENWSSGTDKVGYNLVVRCDDKFEEFFAAYLYIPEKIPVKTRTVRTGTTIEYKNPWSSGGASGAKKLSKGAVSTLINGMDVAYPKRFDVPIGKLREDEWNNEFPVHGRCILGNITETTNGVTRKIDIQLESLRRNINNEKSNKVTNTFSIQQAV